MSLANSDGAEKISRGRKGGRTPIFRGRRAAGKRMKIPIMYAAYRKANSEGSYDENPAGYVFEVEEHRKREVFSQDAKVSPSMKAERGGERATRIPRHVFRGKGGITFTA